MLALWEGNMDWTHPDLPDLFLQKWFQAEIWSHGKNIFYWSIWSFNLSSLPPQPGNPHAFKLLEFGWFKFHSPWNQNGVQMPHLSVGFDYQFFCKRQISDCGFPVKLKIINPFTPMSDQDRISPDNINTISSRQVMRIEKNIN